MVALTNPSFGDLDGDAAAPGTSAPGGDYRGVEHEGSCVLRGTAVFGTRREVDAIVPLLRQGGFTEIQVYDWARAQERVLDDVVRGADVVHVATHGYQIPLGCMARPPRDPLHMSGVVLAGAVRILPDGYRGSQEGLLGAAEVAQLDLSQARLVMWSACATATGSVLPGEPLCGLAAAAWLAGARASVATLWRVSDELMPIQIEAFYRSWVGGGSEARALQAALRAGLRVTRQDRGHGHPTSWAALVVEGL